jgi:hypothetical protein
MKNATLIGVIAEHDILAVIPEVAAWAKRMFYVDSHWTCISHRLLPDGRLLLHGRIDADPNSSDTYFEKCYDFDLCEVTSALNVRNAAWIVDEDSVPRLLCFGTDKSCRKMKTVYRR